MIEYPKGKNMIDRDIENERKHIDMLNEALGNINLTPTDKKSLIWFCGWETSTLQHIISAFERLLEVKKTY